MSGKKNFQTHFSNETHAALERISKTKGLTKAELVRRIIDGYIEAYDRAPEGHGVVATAPVTQAVHIEPEADDLTEREIWINACTEIAQNAGKDWDKRIFYIVRKMFKDGKPVAYGQRLAVNKAYYSLFGKNVECFVFEKEEEQQQPEQQPEKQQQPEVDSDRPLAWGVLRMCEKAMESEEFDDDFAKLVQELREQKWHEQISSRQFQILNKCMKNKKIPTSVIVYLKYSPLAKTEGNDEEIFKYIENAGLNFDSNDDRRKIRRAYEYYILNKGEEPEDWNFGNYAENRTHVQACLRYLYGQMKWIKYKQAHEKANGEITS